MDIIAKAGQILSPLLMFGIAVVQGWYDGNISYTHVTLWDLGSVSKNYSSDTEEIEEYSIQVTIFSSKDEIELAKEIKKMMMDAGFSYQGRNADEADPESGIYMKAQRFSIIVESEE